MFATPQARHRAPARRPGRAAHPHCRSNRIFVARNSLRKPPLRPRLAPPVMLGLIGDAARQAQYGPSPGSFLAPQKRKSGWAGSPIGQRHINSRNSTMVTGSDIGTTTSLTVWGAAASITNVRKARAVLPTTCGLFACRWAARRGALWCGGEAEQAGGAQIDAQAAEEIWLCPRQARHR